VILYEVHRVALQRVPVPVPAPNGAAERLRQAVPPGSERPDDTSERERRFLSSNPDIARGSMAVSLTAAIMAIMILIAPAEGAVVVVFAFAAALVRARLCLSLQQKLCPKIASIRAPEETHADD
jgi:hypothetical protein